MWPEDADIRSVPPASTVADPSRWYLGGADFLRAISREAAPDVLDAYEDEYLELIAVPADGEAAEWSADQLEYDAVQQALIFAYDACPSAVTIRWQGLPTDETIDLFDHLVTQAGLDPVAPLLNMAYGGQPSDGITDMEIAEHTANLIKPYGWSIGGISLSDARHYFIAPNPVIARFAGTAPVQPLSGVAETRETFSYVNDWHGQ